MSSYSSAPDHEELPTPSPTWDSRPVKLRANYPLFWVGAKQRKFPLLTLPIQSRALPPLLPRASKYSQLREIAPAVIKKSLTFEELQSLQPAPLALAASECYFAAMCSGKMRRISAVLLTLALAVGLVTHSVANLDVGLKPAMAAASSDMPMSGKCDGCGDEQKGMDAACVAYCSGVLVSPVVAAVMDVLTADILGPSVVRALTGRTPPPDPYPPRPTILS